MSSQAGVPHSASHLRLLAGRSSHQTDGTDTTTCILCTGGHSTALGSRRAPYHATYDIESQPPFDARLHHIVAMKEFADWSPEQLRWQDYQVCQKFS